ncbi:unnamed protein product [Closterium sp. NIES-53]
MKDQVAQNRQNYLWTTTTVAKNDLTFNVSGPLLDKLKADSEDLVRPLKESWKTRRCTLSIDRWTCIKFRSLVCVIAQNDTAPIIVDIVDLKTAKKNRGLLGKSYSQSDHHGGAEACRPSHDGQRFKQQKRRQEATRGVSPYLLHQLRHPLPRSHVARHQQHPCC